MHERRDKNRTLHPSRNQGRPPTPLEVSARTTKRGDSSSGIPRQPRGTPSHNLPAPRSSFVGREQEIEEAKSELEVTRLITLTGAGGSGKTRLALEVARDLVEAYPDGVWLVELAPLSEEVLVPKTLSENFSTYLEQRRISPRMGLPISAVLEGDAPYEQGYHNE